MEGVKPNFMVFTMNKCCYGFIVILGIISASYGDGETRQVSSPVLNPGCNLSDGRCNNTWLAHVTAVGKNDTLHHLWSAVDAPTFMVARTSNGAELEVNWTNFINWDNGSISFKEWDEVDYVFGFVITNMILFNDTNDTGIIDNVAPKERLYVPMTDFTWEIKEIVNESTSAQGIFYETDTYLGEDLPEETKIVFKVMALGEEGRRSTLPHLISTADSALLNITLDDLVLNISKSSLLNEDFTPPIAGFNHPRWAMEMIIFSMEHREDISETFKFHTVKSLDDENSPGVFNIDDITTNLSREEKTGGYFQWRPACYLTTDLDITYSTVPTFNTTFNELEKLESPATKSLAYAMFGKGLIETLVSTNTTVSFGQPSDGFYTKYNYTTWTLAYGLGSPPEETFSSAVIIIISLGSGIPVLVFLVGGMFVGYRKLRGH